MNVTETLLKTIPKKNAAAKPKKWWHWILMYPTLAIFLLGNVPTLQQLFLSVKHNVSFSKAYDAERQGAYWERNFEDLQDKDFDKTLIDKNGVTVKYSIFDSGDILIRTINKDGPDSMRWIGFENLVPSESASPFAVKEAKADGWHADGTPAGASKRIVCKKRLGGGRILVRVRYGSGGCFDEIIETGSGRILRKNRASCDASCN